ncbi:1-pyrroline-5-carboxylate dehydrogenase 1 [Planctomycetes bacterium Pan216]|uniref:L-glutamate gamma-semialdehyde dehydrogenase n=1 Tax=Kolteria novifilia TaxID=2527975 RepID=A0A518B838_9BACT|nr:1-pyrroline-5-carboxylate dehydrogenase 1 [Planctomycetes bacterium Pan216]
MIRKHPRTSIDDRVMSIGRDIFNHVNTAGPTFLSPKWWDDWIMQWSMADEAVKVQMFRFIDVLPMLDSCDSVAEHVQAYFDDPAGTYPFLVRLGAQISDPGTMHGAVLARVIRQNATRLAKRFIAGTTPQEVLTAVELLRQDGMAFTMDLLGEATVTEQEADAYLEQYLELLATLGPKAALWPEVPRLDRDHQGPIPKINLSVKVTGLYSQFDPIDPAGTTKHVAARLREIFRAARRHHAAINVDMEQYATKDLTLRIVRELLDEPEFRDWPDCGIAIQAYLRDTEQDLRDLDEWVRKRGTPIGIRLVKGAYWDYETVSARQNRWPIPVYTNKWESDACFERCTSFLLSRYERLRPAIASHNVRSLAHALALAEHEELPPGSFELQMLYGMGDELKEAILERDLRLRIYTPFGKLLPGMAYLVRRLLENTSNTSFLRATFTEHAAVEQLLMKPGPKPLSREDRTIMHTAPRETLAPFTNEALSDFSQPAARESMEIALSDVRQQFGRKDPLWIGGEDVLTEEWLESVNPSDPVLIVGRVPKATTDHADRAVAAAKEAFPLWRRTSVWRRVDVLFQAAKRMRERRFELAAWMVYESGKQWREADADVAEAIDFCEFYARSMLELSGVRERNLPGERNDYFYTARGVTAVISPWNFPLAILCGMTMAPLVCGNPVILKPAEQSSVIAARLVEILRGLDLPPGVVNFVPGLGEEVGRHLVRHPDVSIITFTGSVPVGLDINQAAAEVPPEQRHVKHVVAEMGGKNAIIVDNDADPDEAIRGVVESAFGFQGQKCSACSRVIVLGGIYEAFKSRLTDAVGSLTLGPPEDPGYAVGPVIDQEAFVRLQQQIEQATHEATLLANVDPGALKDRGFFVGPHLFEEEPDQAATSLLGQTELFGPVLAIYRADDLDHALRLANATRYALTGGVYSRNPRTIARVREELEVGNLYINRKISGAFVDLQPFGGFKLSGIGAKAGGPDYLKQFLMPRTITENTLRRGFAPETEDG